jgi:hypothetical protein
LWTSLTRWRRSRPRRCTGHNLRLFGSPGVAAACGQLSVVPAAARLPLACQAQEFPACWSKLSQCGERLGKVDCRSLRSDQIGRVIDLVPVARLEIGLEQHVNLDHPRSLIFRQSGMRCGKSCPSHQKPPLDSTDFSCLAKAAILRHPAAGPPGSALRGSARQARHEERRDGLHDGLPVGPWRAPPIRINLRSRGEGPCGILRV